MTNGDNGGALIAGAAHTDSAGIHVGCARPADPADVRAGEMTLTSALLAIRLMTIDGLEFRFPVLGPQACRIWRCEIDPNT